MPSKPVIPAAKPSHKSKLASQKKSPKKIFSPQEKLRRLFNSLCAQIDGGHFKNALKTCDKILRIDSHDKDALQTKLFLLLQTEQYDTALALLTSTGSPGEHDFEKAYALYRQHKEVEAVDLLSSLKKRGEDQRGILHLDAQLKYRQGLYEAAFDIYTQLLDTSAVQAEEHADLLTNLNASQTQLDFLTTGFLHALDALPGPVSSSLESAPPPVPPVAASAALISPATIPNMPSAEPVPAIKKVRASRVPKGVVPGVTPPPDPERWLKKSERSNFGQGGGKRRKAGGGGATQGSTAEPTSASHSAKSGGGKQKKRK